MTREGISFQEQFRILVETLTAPDGTAYKLSTIAQAIDVSEQSLAYLLDGRTQYPRLNTLRRLCRFYDISLDYFACTSEAECSAFLVQRAAQNASPMIREIDEQAATLTPSGVRRVLRLLERLRNLRRSGKN